MAAVYGPPGAEGVQAGWPVLCSSAPAGGNLQEHVERQSWAPMFVTRVWTKAVRCVRIERCFQTHVGWLSVSRVVVEPGKMYHQEDMFSCLWGRVHISIHCGICALTDTRSQFNTDYKKSLVKYLYSDAFMHSRNSYLACFWYPVLQLKWMFCKTYKNCKQSVYIL